MTKQARTCSPDDRLSRVAPIMWDTDIGFVPVVDAEQHLTSQPADPTTRSPTRTGAAAAE